MRAVVVGGGLAGIAAALDLADSGATVTLAEVRPRLGGAAYSFERDGIELDNGQHVFLRCCTAYRALLARLGVADLTVMQERLSIPLLAPGGRRWTLTRDRLPAPLHLARALIRHPFLSPAERLRSVRAARALGRVDPDDPNLDEVTLGFWLSERGVSAHSALWDLIALPALNLRAADASLAQAAMVFQTGLLRDAAAGDIGWARVPLSQLHGQASERALRDAGVELRLRTRAGRISAGPEVELDGERVAADAVIVAVPHTRAADLLPAKALGSGPPLSALGQSPIVNLHVVYDRPVLDVPFAAGVGSPVQYVFDRGAPAGHGGQRLAVSLSAADREARMSVEELRAEFLPALAELLPRARSARAERFLVTREHAATFRAVPGARAARPPARTDAAGVFLAGAWTDTGWPATMEGAVRSGQAAARAALTTARPAPALVGVA